MKTDRPLALIATCALLLAACGVVNDPNGDPAETLSSEAALSSEATDARSEGSLSQGTLSSSGGTSDANSGTGASSAGGSTTRSSAAANGLVGDWLYTEGSDSDALSLSRSGSFVRVVQVGSDTVTRTGLWRVVGDSIEVFYSTCSLVQGSDLAVDCSADMPTEEIVGMVLSVDQLTLTTPEGNSATFQRVGTTPQSSATSASSAASLSSRAALSSGTESQLVGTWRYADESMVDTLLFTSTRDFVRNATTADATIAMAGTWSVEGDSLRLANSSCSMDIPNYGAYDCLTDMGPTLTSAITLAGNELTITDSDDISYSYQRLLALP